MIFKPHQDPDEIAINCAVITISDTRAPETDRSGKLIQELLLEAGHQVKAYAIVKDEPRQIQIQLSQLCDRADIDSLILNGGTGIAPRDTTYDVLANLLDKTLPGFGEL